MVSQIEVLDVGSEKTFISTFNLIGLGLARGRMEGRVRTSNFFGLSRTPFLVLPLSSAKRLREENRLIK